LEIFLLLSGIEARRLRGGGKGAISFVISNEDLRGLPFLAFDFFLALLLFFSGELGKSII